MKTTDIEDVYLKSSKVSVLAESLLKPNQKVLLKGMNGSLVSFVASAIFKKVNLSFLLLFSNREEAAYVLNDLEVLLGEESVLFYPSSYKKPYQIEQTDNTNVLLRAEVLNKISESKKPLIMVSYPEALFEKVPTQKNLVKNTLRVELGKNYSIDFINELLLEYEFERVDFVYEPGQFSIRGGIIDVFSYANDFPFRIEFFGEEVESIRTFDAATQLSINTHDKRSTVIQMAGPF